MAVKYHWELEAYQLAREGRLCENCVPPHSKFEVRTNPSGQALRFIF